MNMAIRINRLVALGLTLLAVWLIPPAGPAQAVILFESHPFAATKSEIAVSGAVEDCSRNSAAGPLCERNFRFMDLEWMVKYRFEQNRLTQVLLFTEHTQADRTSLLEELSKDYHLAALKRGGIVLDLVRLSSRLKKDRLEERARRFEKQGLAENNLVYVFLEKSGLNRKARKAKNISEMMANMSIMTRELDIWVEDYGYGKRMVLSFAMPRATMRLRPHLSKMNPTRRKAPRPKVSTYTSPRPEPVQSSYQPALGPVTRGEGRL